MTQNDEEVKTDLLLMTNASTPSTSSNELQSTSNTATNISVSEEFPLMMSSTHQQDDILTRTQTHEFERKDRMCTKVIYDTTLRIYFPKDSDADPLTQNKSTVIGSLAPENSVTDTELKDQDEDINIQG